MNTTTCQCESCGISFEKPTNEYKRSIKVGRKFYCSRTCSGKAVAISNLVPYMGQGNISIHSGNKRDELTGFREFIRRARSRGKFDNITAKYLKEIWELQKGVCPYSGANLVIPTKGTNNTLYTASLDRIDSSLPYQIGNVQFISTAMNYMKGVLSHEKTLELCKMIVEKHS